MSAPHEPRVSAPTKSRQRTSGAARRVLAFLGVTIAGGAVLTAGLTPALAATGLANQNTLGIFENLPEYLDLGQLAQKTEIYAKAPDGSDVLLANFFAQNREEVGWDQVSQFVKDAAISTEDPRFYDHGGVDLQGTIRAVVSNVLGNDVQGGSSITQQYVKNVLVQKAEAISDPAEAQAAYDEATATTPERKLKEMKLAIDLEKKYSKDDILLGYLNIAGYGGRIYGIEAAANYYFATTAANLTLAQSASLLAIVNNPSNLRIDVPENIPANKERRDYVLAQMLKEGKISKADHDAAVAEEVVPTITPTQTGCQTAGNAAYFCDYVTNVVRNDPAFGDTEDTRWANFQRGGYKIYTTLDLDLQGTAQGITDLWVPKAPVDEVNIGSASVSMQVGTGRILAMVQNKDFNEDPDVSGENYSAVNFNTDRDYGGSQGFQVGSTYKVFTLAEWLAEGHTINETLNGRERTFYDFPASCATGGEWTGPFEVNNDAGENGSYSVLSATRQSINTVFVAMAQELDLCKIRDRAAAFGVKAAQGGELDYIPAGILGAASPISPLSMVTAFAGFANNGSACTAIAIDSITDATGAAVTPPASTCTQALSPELTSVANYALQQVVTSGSATASEPDDDTQHIGKTGTTDDAVHTWMDGASTTVANVTWVGNITGDDSMRDLYVESADGENESQAATLRHKIWNAIMTRADVLYPAADFPEPSNALLRGSIVSVPDLTGKTVDDAETALDNLGFDYSEGGSEDSALPAGTITRTDPVAGTTVDRYSEITYWTSNGSQSAIPDVVGMTEEEATEALAAFTVVTQIVPVTSEAQDGVVVSMSPAGGSAVLAGSTITLSIGELSEAGDVVPTTPAAPTTPAPGATTESGIVPAPSPTATTGG